MADETKYEILGVGEDASGKEIREAYRHLLMRVHPDQGGSDALCRVVEDAYETLSDQAARDRYDRERKRGRRTPPASDADEGPEYATPEDDRWTSPPSPEEDDAESAAPQAWVRAWSRAGGLIAVHPSLTTLLLGILLLAIALTTDTFGFGMWGFLLAVLGLNGLWGRLRATRLGLNASREDMSHIDGLGGTGFEQYLKRLFLAEGYDVRHTGGTGDFGADLLLRRAGMLTVVQAKRSITPVGVSAIQEAFGAQAHYDAQHAMVVTNSCFTPSAEELAESTRVELWDRRMLAELVAKHGSRQAQNGWALWWAEFRWGLPGSLRFAWTMFILSVWAMSLFADSITPPGQRRSGSKRRRRSGPKRRRR
jgi:restriction system protein